MAQGVELHRGITGFRHADDEPLPASDLKAFRAYCFSAARSLSGRVSRIELPYGNARNNFASGVLELPEGATAVLLNAHFPIVAFARPPREGHVRLAFVEAPGLVELFRSFGVYEVLEASDLERPLVEEDCRRLGPAERDAVRYWKPERVGDLVFNSWD